MKKYLIDTHVVIWLMFNSHKIPIEILKIITDLNNEVYISTITFWEISIKYGLNKLDLGKFNPSDLETIYIEQGFKILNLTVLEASSYWRINSNHHKDPFDRMLIWQAINNNYILISNDINMKPYENEGLKLIW